MPHRDATTAAPEPLAVHGLTRMGYEEALALQVSLREVCIEGGGEALLLVEHPPTITLGRKGSRDDIVAPLGELRRRGVRVFEAGRGGRATYHGPGQLVAYPILDLRRRGRSLHRYLRELEAWLVRLCRRFGVAAHAGSPQTGVWVGERKIASIGVAARRWVSYHGVALNVTTDPSAFELIVPCGLRGVRMTSLAAELGEAPPMDAVAQAAAALFAEQFGPCVAPPAQTEAGAR